MDKILRTERGGNDLPGFLYSLLLVMLAVVGMTGLVYHVLAPGGAIAGALGRLFSGYPVLSFLVLVGLLAMFFAARTQVGMRQRNQEANEVPLYFFVAIGMFFAGRLLVFGRL
jgi:hypothetical protein